MEIKIIVGSTSRHKLSAVKSVCKKLGFDFEITGVRTESGQNEQPIGLAETVAGALSRAQSAQKEDRQAIAIGIESGILRTGEPLSVSLDLAVIVALFGNERIITTSTGMQFPEEFVKMAEQKGFNNHTVGSVISDELGGDNTDPHYFLSQGIISRRETIEQGLLIVMKQIAKITRTWV